VVDHNPCNGSTVSTSGTATEITVTSGENTSASFNDSEHGDGYFMVNYAAGSFTSRASVYPVPFRAQYFNATNPFLDFWVTGIAYLYVNGSNAPDGVDASVTNGACGGYLFIPPSWAFVP